MVVPILLVIAALVLLVLEVLVVSLGALGLAAAACATVGIVLGFQESPAFGWSLVGVMVVGGPSVLYGALKALPHLKFTRGFYLKRPDLTAADRHAAAPDRQDLVGALGEASSHLRPAGSARFGSEILSVMTDGVPVKRGTRVRVVEVRGNRILVEEVPAANP